MPGMRADLAVFEDLKDFRVISVYKDGVLAAQNGTCIREKQDRSRELAKVYPKVFDSFHMDEVTLQDISFEKKGDMERVIQFKPHELLTEERILPWQEMEGMAPGVNPQLDIVKAAVFERHLNTGHTGIGFIGGYGLRCGAVATSVAHDSHNLIVVGTNDSDMVLAANTVRKNKGGLAVVVNGQVAGELALPIGGIMTGASVAQVEEQLGCLKEKTRELGISPDIDAFMTLAFVSLPVIPRLRINTYGVIDVDEQKVVEASF